MTATDSPDILTEGRWECVRGVQRWVAGPAALASVDSTEPDGRCVECGIEVEKAYCKGKCRRCYDAKRRTTDIRRRPSVETAAEWRELKAHGLTVKEAAMAMGISQAALYAAIKRANRYERSRAA